MPLACLTFVAAAGACSSTREAISITRSLGPYTVTLDDAPGAIHITGGGRKLLDFDVTRFAFRAGTATHETKFGSFKVIETAGDWRYGATLGEIAQAGSDGPLTFAITGGSVRAHGTLVLAGDGHLALTVSSDDVRDNRAKIAFACAKTDHFAGLGAQSADVDHRGQNVPLWVSEPGVGKREDDEITSNWFVQGRRHTTSIPIPAVVTSRGTALVLDTYAYANFDLCAASEARVEMEAWEHELRLHLFDGPEPLAALSRMTTFVGRPPMPPPWAFAPWNDAVTGSDAVRAFAKLLRDEKIPSSAIWTEDFRGGSFGQYGYRIAENWRVDRTLYPDLEQLIADLKTQGMAMQLYYNPHVIGTADIADDARTGGHLVSHTNGEPYYWQGADGTFGDQGTLDLTRPETRAFAKTLLKEGIAQGALGWMADFGEWTPVDDAKLANGEDPEQLHNRYPLLWQQVNREAMTESGMDSKMAVYFRSGHLRSQASAGIVWAGDQRTSFQDDDGLPTIIPIGLGLAATGFPFYGHDIAGYQFLGNSAPQESTKELFFRWTMLGALSPVMRTHHGIKLKENWNLARDAETLAHYKRYAELHIRLYPYLRSLAHRAVDEGRPLWIPMGLLHPMDDAVWGVKDEFFLGDALLVAPVVTEGQTARDVVFPTGRYAPLLAAGEAIVGPATQNVAAPMTEIPLFIAAGGIVPMTREPAQTLFEGTAEVPGIESTMGDRVVYVGLGAPATFREEDGATYTLEGVGTTRPTAPVDLVGEGSFEGDGYKLTLVGHPAARKTHVEFR